MAIFMIQTKGYFRSLLIAVVASLAAPIVMCIFGIFGSVKYIYEHGWGGGSGIASGIASLMVYMMGGYFFSLLFTLPIAAVSALVARLLKISISDGHLALVIAAALITADAVYRNAWDALPLSTLLIGTNALAFFLLEKYAGSFFGLITNNK